MIGDQRRYQTFTAIISTTDHPNHTDTLNFATAAARAAFIEKRCNEDSFHPFSLRSVGIENIHLDVESATLEAFDAFAPLT